MDTINKYLLVLLGFSIPVSTGATNILLGLFLLIWMLDNAGDRFKRNRMLLKSNPVAVMGLIMFLIFIAGISYTNADKPQIIDSLKDAAKFLFIPIALIYFADKKFSFFFMWGFLSAMLIILLFSYLIRMDLLPSFIPVKGSRLNCTVFFNHISQNIFMAYTAFIFAVWARFASKLSFKLLWAMLSLAALFNVYFLVLGRTGHLVLAVLLIYFSITWNRRKSIITTLAMIVFIGAVSWIYPSGAIYSRIKTAITEVKEWEYGKPASHTSSSGLRLEYYLNTIELIKKNPAIGTGTGSFKKNYQDLVADTEMDRTANPHNDYLFITVQFGLAGLLIFLAFFIFQWREASRIQDIQTMLLCRGFVLTIVVSCMVSSSIQDSAEGWFFAFMSAFFFSQTDPGIRRSTRV